MARSQPAFFKSHEGVRAGKEVVLTERATNL
jgi:hypothetical protein